jgi:FkbM family methyltransferase
MLNFLKNRVKDLVISAGYDLRFHKINTKYNDAFQLVSTLKYFGINTVFDIGANTGQFAQEIRKVGFDGLIISFEPLTNAYQKLTTNASTDPNWIIHPQTAIGDHDGEIEINVSNNSYSSILPMLTAHTNAAPSSFYINKEKVLISRLDTVCSNYLKKDSRYFIKIDTQGYEWSVLDGGESILANALGVCCELSIVPLYEGQHLWQEIIERLKHSGFTLWAIQKGFTDANNGRALQVEGIFIRSSLIENNF